MRFQYLSLALLSWALTGCVTTENVGTYSSLRLCEAYAGGMDPVIKDELVRRGHADCTTPAAVAEAVAERRAARAKLAEAVAAGLKAASASLKNSFPTPRNCTSTLSGNQVQTTCY